MTIRTIGIDPGKKTGVAICTDGELSLHTVDFWAAQSLVYNYEPGDVELIVIEVSTNTHVWHPRGKGSIAAAARTGQHVGAARREGELLVEGLSRTGYRVETVEPMGKVDAEVFAAVTGHKGRTNEHTRDAAMLARYGYRLARMKAKYLRN